MQNKENVDWVEAEEKAKMKRPPVGTAAGPTAKTVAAEWDKIFPFSTQRRRRLHFLPSLRSFPSRRNAFELPIRWKTITWTIGENADYIGLKKVSKHFVLMSSEIFQNFK